MYVRETWCKDERGGVDCFYYKADMPKTEIWKGFWKPSIHMPKTAARIFLEVTGVRCERIADISEFDVISEGITQVTKDNGRTWKYGLPDMDGLPAGGCGFGWEWSEFELQPAAAFHKLIASINGPEVIEQNAWFWVYDFKVIDKPENF